MVIGESRLVMSGEPSGDATQVSSSATTTATATPNGEG